MTVVQAIALAQVRIWKDAGLYPADMYRQALDSAPRKIESARHSEFRRALINRNYLARFGLSI
ncbi:hypothetical protein AB0C87_24750 [Actinomadura sp. NPDC048021]|uniref:hypothetical protein n=1 Tax=Actinomadura sp. NPDC048021 TaxID=3155385 RepID=UPI0033D9B765